MDIMKTAQLERRIDEMRSSPIEAIRKKAEDAKRVLGVAGYDAAKTIVDEAGALEGKSLIDVLDACPHLKGWTRAAIARLIRAGSVSVGGKVTLSKDLILYSGAGVSLTGIGTGDARKAVHEYKVP